MDQNSFCLVAATTALALPSYAQQLLMDSYGTHGSAQYGAAVSRIADVTGDGVPEIVVGSPNYSAGSSLPTIGRTQVVEGRYGNVLHTIAPFGTPNTRFGTVVLGVTDLNGDGRADYVVGSPDLMLSTNNYGVVTAHDGLTGGTLWTCGVFGTNLRRFGSAITQIGDGNGDGARDLVVGFPGAFVNTGVKRVDGRTGTGGTLLKLGTAASEMGKSLITLSDLTGDGQPEFLVGEPSFNFQGDSGRLSAINAMAQTQNNVVYTQLNYPYYWGAGERLARIDDVDGDGKDDFLMVFRGSQSAGPWSGRVVVCSGATGATLGTVFPTAANPSFGAAISGIGDFDGDGFPDFAVGSPDQNGGAGQVDVFSGPTRALITTIYGAPGSRFGCSLAPLCDLDGDGRQDFVVGARDHVVNGVAVGRVAVFGLEVVGDAKPFGVGCVGQAAGPTVSRVSGPFVPRPAPGVSVTYSTGNLSSAAVSLWIWGYSNITWGPVALPVDLAVIGVPNCNLLVSPDVIQSYAGGSMQQSLLIPANPLLVGQHIYLQVAGLGSGYPNGLAISAGLDTRIGNTF
jgi:hypothetical protein